MQNLGSLARLLYKQLLTAAGGVEERLGNYTAAKDFYQASLKIEPCAPTLVSLGMLELRQGRTKVANMTMVEVYFQQALLLDPRHGPAYNAYGKMELRRGNTTVARKIYERGMSAKCTDPASVFHGMAKLELSVGNVDKARQILRQGLKEVEAQDRSMDSARFHRDVFLIHSLGMLELNSNRAAEAERVFMDGLKKHTRSSQLLLGAALSKVKLGSEDSARDYFERSIKANKRHAQAWQAWGVMESRAGNIATAQRLFAAGVKANPRHGALWQAYGKSATHVCTQPLSFLTHTHTHTHLV